MFGLPQYLSLASPSKCLSRIDEIIEELEENKPKFRQIVERSTIIEEDEHRDRLIRQYDEYITQLTEARNLYIV